MSRVFLLFLAVLAFFLTGILPLYVSCSNHQRHHANSATQDSDSRMAGPTSGNTPEQMFEALLLSPIPAGVTKLEGVGDSWQGYSFYVRFQAPDTVIDSIIASGYQPDSWPGIKYRFDLPTGYDRFTPDWNPAEIENKECYSAEVQNGWTHGGTHYLVIDQSTGTVYFYGIGA